MGILETVDEFITNGDHILGIFSILEECIKEGSVKALIAVQNLFESDYQGYTYNFQLKAPAAYCLIHWKEQGLDTIIDTIQKSPSSKNVSLALEVLANLSAYKKIENMETWIQNDYIIKVLNEDLENWIDVNQVSRRKLNELILSFKTDKEVASAIGSKLGSFSLTNMNAAKQLFSALSLRWLTVSRPVINEYEDLIRRFSDDETKFQSFFELYPQLLEPMVSQVWPRPNLHGFQIPDFVIRRRDNTYLIVEIEKPSKSLIINANQLSSQAVQAVTQAMNYKSFLMENYTNSLLTFPKFNEPECLVVIGMENQLTQDQVNALIRENQYRHRLRIVGFDWITKRAEAIINNVIENAVDVQFTRMV